MSVPTNQRRCYIGGLVRCCTETIKTTETPSEVGDILVSRTCGDHRTVGADGKWRWTRSD